MPSLLEKLKERAAQAGVSDTLAVAIPLEPKEGYPIPTTEAEFAADERAAIIEFDGGPSMLSGTAQMVMEVFDGTIH